MEKLKPNCWDCKHFERVRMAAYCHCGKKVTKLRQKDWYSGSVKSCTYFDPKIEREEIATMEGEEDESERRSMGTV